MAMVNIDADHCHLFAQYGESGEYFERINLDFHNKIANYENELCTSIANCGTVFC